MPARDLEITKQRMNDSDEEFVPHVDPVPPPLEIWWQEDNTPRENELETESDTPIRWVEE